MNAPTMPDLWLNGMTAVTWQFAVLAMISWGLLKALGGRLSARARHAIWLVVLLRLVVPVGIASPWGLAGQEPLLDIPSAESQPAPTRESTASASATTHHSYQLPNRVGWNSWLLVGWLTVSALLLATWLFRSVRFAVRVRRSWDTAPVWFCEEVELLRRRLGLKKPIQVRIIDGALISGPGVTGFLQPRIVVPVSMVSNSTHEQRTAVIAHELVHVARRDFLVQPLSTILQCLYFFHPAVWLVARNIRSERENAVDDRVVSSLGERTTDYAEVLLDYARNGRYRLQAPALGMAAHRSQVARRLARMLADGYRANRRSRRPALAVVVLSILITLTVAASSPDTSADDGERPRVRVTITYPEAQTMGGGQPAWVEPGGDFEIGRPNIDNSDLQARLASLPDEVFDLFFDHWAVLEATIDRTGAPVTVNVVEAVEAPIDEILVAYTKALRFTPTLHFRDGPVPFKVKLIFGIPQEEPEFVPKNLEPSLGSDELEARFKEIYSLQPGRALKLLLAPHNEERLELYRLRSPGQAEAIPSGPDMMLIEIRDGVPWVIGNGFGGVTVKRVISMAGFSEAKMTGDSKALGRELIADIVVSENSTPEQRLGDLAGEIASRVAVRVEPVRREMQVIVIRGSFGDVCGTPVSGSQPSIWITLEDHDQDGSGGGRAPTARKFADLLERTLNIPVEVDGVPDPEEPVFVGVQSSAFRTERLQKLFDRIEAQCDLQLSLETREIELLSVENLTG